MGSFQKGNQIGKVLKGRPSNNPGGRPTNASKTALRELLIACDAGGESMRDRAVANLGAAMKERVKGKMTKASMDATLTVLKYTDPQEQHVVLTERQPSNISPEEAQRADDIVRATLAARTP